MLGWWDHPGRRRRPRSRPGHSDGRRPSGRNARGDATRLSEATIEREAASIAREVVAKIAVDWNAGVVRPPPPFVLCRVPQRLHKPREPVSRVVLVEIAVECLDAPGAMQLAGDRSLVVALSRKPNLIVGSQVAPGSIPSGMPPALKSMVDCEPAGLSVSRPRLRRAAPRLASGQALRRSGRQANSVHGLNGSAWRSDRHTPRNRCQSSTLYSETDTSRPASTRR